jgi:hypothetical protein
LVFVLLRQVENFPVAWKVVETMKGDTIVLTVRYF